MEARNKRPVTPLLSVGETRQTKLFHIFNTSESFVEDICYTHLEDKIKCSCTNKNIVGRVRTLTNYYEKVKNSVSIESRISLYQLKPSVLERIKNYEKNLI